MSRKLPWGLELAAAVFCRFLLNVARRFAYPFAPELSRELQVPLTSITSMLAVNQATGFLGFFFGPLADRFGYRNMMAAGLAVLSAGMLAAGLAPVYGVVFAGIALAGLGKNLFDPSLQAHVGQKVPFERRGTTIGILETSWAASTLVGVPAVGLMMESWGWRSPFFVLSALGAAGILLVLLPGRVAAERGEARVYSGGGIRLLLKELFRNPAAGGIMGFSFFASAANDSLFVVYGAWFERSFGLGLAQLGFGAAVIGAAELGGEFLTAAVADRIGLKRAVISGTAASSLCYLSLPFLDASLPLALSGLFAVFLTFEFTIVSSISLCTELMPRSRATMMSAFLAAAGLGRVAGALCGGALWISWGIAGVATVSSAAGILALACLFRGTENWR